jgi:hypothetical protein
VLASRADQASGNAGAAEELQDHARCPPAK